MATTRKGLWWARHDRLRGENPHRKDRRRGADRPGRGLRPGLDALEARVTPSTFTPNTFSDLTSLNQSVLQTTDVNSSNGEIISLTTQDPVNNPLKTPVITLRSAIIAANADNADDPAGAPYIIDLSAGTYLLSIAPPAGSNGGDGQSGELPVTGPLTITGVGSASTIVEAGTSATNGISKVFSFNPFNPSHTPPEPVNGFPVILTGLTIQFGKNQNNDPTADGEGGAFDFDAGPDGKGSLTMSDVVVNGNSTTNGDGGGIALFDAGVVSITNSQITNNTATGATGGGSGGGIYVGFASTVTASAKLTITGSTISGNVTAGAAAQAGGGIFSFATFPVAIHSSTISGNKTGTSHAVNGGGIADVGTKGLTIDLGSTISGNSASQWGGGLYSTETTTITGVAIINNAASSGSSSEGGGGIFADQSSADITVTDSRIVDNTATQGGSQLDGNGGSSNGGILDAANNWFGTNTNPLPSGFFGAGVKTLTTTPFLVMTFAASPTSLNSGATSALTAAITKNSVGTTGFSIPDGTPASFSGGTVGSVNPSSKTTTSGTATSTFTAGASAGKGNISASIDNQTLMVQITVVGVPTAIPQTVSVPFNTATAITLTGSDPNSPPLTLTFTVASNPSHGMLTGTAPNLTYTPNTGFHGSDSFTFTVNNGINTSTAATVTLNVAAGVPTANPQTVSVAFNTAKAITLTGSGPDSPALSLTFAFANPSHGVLTGTARNLTYTPNTGFHGSDSFTFTVNNGINTSTAATVTLNVAAGVPTANPQTVTLNENASVGVSLTGSDPDIPALSLTYAIVAGQGPAHGAISNLNPNTGTLTYTPNANYFGADSFKFTVSNGINASAPATVSLAINQVAATVSGTVGVSWGTAGTATLSTNAGGLLLPANRNKDLPWLGINKLSITLSQPETLSASDVSVTGISVPSYGLVTISGSGTNYTITLAQPINVADRVTITIGNANIATYTRRLDVLPGDVNDDGVVNSLDMVVVRNMYLGFGTVTVPVLWGDINGDGVVNVTDYNLVRARVGTHLP